jgi:hypothetical protein
MWSIIGWIGCLLFVTPIVAGLGWVVFGIPFRLVNAFRNGIPHDRDFRDLVVEVVLWMIVVGMGLASAAAVVLKPELNATPTPKAIVYFDGD